MKQEGTLSSKNDYRQIAKETKDEIEKAHSFYLKNIISNDLKDIRSNGRKFWKLKNKILTENNSNITNLYKNEKTKEITSDNKQMADALNKQFESVFTSITNTLPDTETNENNIIGEIKVTRQGIVKFLKKQKGNKAMGADEISYKILKQCSEETADYLADLFNTSLQTSELPNDWKHAEVVPLFKKDDPLKPCNYRPISLTSLICKMLEHIIVSNTNQHLSKHNMLNKNLHGFRKMIGIGS